MWIGWRSFMREIMVKGWVAIVLSSHIPCCTPTHWYIPLLSHWASHDSLWPIHSLSLTYLFSLGLRAFSCALCIYCLDLWVSWALCHCSCVLSLVIHDFFFCYIVHLYFVYLWVLSLSFWFFRFYLPLCDDDALSSRSCRLGLSHPSFHP